MKEKEPTIKAKKSISGKSVEEIEDQNRCFEIWKLDNIGTTSGTTNKRLDRYALDNFRQPLH